MPCPHWNLHAIPPLMRAKQIARHLLKSLPIPLIYNLLQSPTKANHCLYCILMPIDRHICPYSQCVQHPL